MQQRNVGWLILIGILVLAAIWVVADGAIPGTKINYTIHQGLDLQGGLQALLEADVPDSSNSASMAWAWPNRSFNSKAPAGL